MDVNNLSKVSSSSHIDICAVRIDHQGLFMHSSLGQIPRILICKNNGKYKLNYKMFAQGFPMFKSTLDLDLNYTHQSSLHEKTKQRLSVEH